MNKVIKVQHFANAHLAWLACLHQVLAQVRHDGLMSIEGDVDNPEHEASVFYPFPQTLEQPYLGFATDILRMMVSGNLNADELQVYVDHAIAGHSKGLGFVRTDSSLLRTIWLTLWASLKGYAPVVACEYGRQAMPVKLKPTFGELDDLLRELKKSAQREGVEDLDAAVDEFMALMGEETATETAPQPFLTRAEINSLLAPSRRKRRNTVKRQLVRRR